MIAIIYSGDVVVGIHPTPDIDEMEGLGTQYDLLNEVPDIIVNTPAGHFVRRIAQGEYVLDVLTPSEPEAEPDRITQLENESAMIALELVDTQIRLDQTEAEQAALLLELIDKGVL